jgi:two-component system nitrogen regulation sensor histidine kinase NtrY
MTADVETMTGPEPRAFWRRPSLAAMVEIGVIVAAIVMGGITYAVLNGNGEPQDLLSPGITALLLLGNLIPVVALLALVGRRIAKRRALRAAGAGNGRLHVRLVAIFSLIASVPIILTVIAASVMFQSVNQFWASNKAEDAFNSTIGLVEDAQKQSRDRWIAEAQTMAKDIVSSRDTAPPGTAVFNRYLAYQSYNRHFKEAVFFTFEGKDGINVIGVCDFPQVCKPPEQTAFDQRVTPDLLRLIRNNPHPVINFTPDTLWVVVGVPEMDGAYLYVGTAEDAAFLSRQVSAASDVLRDYKDLQHRSRALQLKFNAALFAVAVLIIALTVWIALAVADRLVRPVNELAGAARRVADGDLAVRVPEPGTNDEVGTLGSAFNVMTQRLEAQTTALENRLDRF